MVEAGYVTSIREAFAKWLGRGLPAYVPRSKLSPFEAVELIRTAGGVAALAHPGCGVPDSLIRPLVRAGIGGELFDEVAPKWMDAYMRNEIACGLRPDARKALEDFRRAGFRQVILSASKRDNLLGQMARFDILPFFDDVLGLDHIYATSKEGIGKAWMAENAVVPADCVMIGDTLHDADVARAMGCRCILVRGGHQLPGMLETAGCAVAGSLQEAARMAAEG